MIPLIGTLEISLWLKFVIDATMKSFMIFAMAGLFGFVLRRHSAAVRGLVWSLAIVGCLVVPLFSLTLPQWEVSVLPRIPERFEVDRWLDNRQPRQITCSNSGESVTVHHFINPSYITTYSIEIHDQREWCSSIQYVRNRLRSASLDRLAGGVLGDRHTISNRSLVCGNRCCLAYFPP